MTKWVFTYSRTACQDASPRIFPFCQRIIGAVPIYCRGHLPPPICLSCLIHQAIHRHPFRSCLIHQATISLSQLPGSAQ